MNKKAFLNSQAFTLIEILVVTSIISLLSTVVVNESKESRLKADDAHMKRESNELANAVNLYKNDNGGKVPVGDTQRNAGYPIVYENDTEGTASAYQESMQKLVDGGYISEIPTSPSGEDYSYYVTEDEDSAMFGAELNFESSGSSNKSSCEFVELESYNPSNCIFLSSLDFNYQTGQYIDYPEGWIEIGGGDYDVFCGKYGHPICTGGNGVGANYCASYVGAGACMMTIGGTPTILCEPVDNGVECNGSSNLDYCSCI